MQIAAAVGLEGVRIGGGIWKGRRLSQAPGEVRPTTAQSREVLFNWLGERIRGRHCLDLFAGAGALSLEAVSRGAATATMIEIDGKRCQALRKQLATLLATSPDETPSNCMMLTRTDALRWLPHTTRRLARQPNDPPPHWNLIFVDPPYDWNRLGDCLQRLTDLVAVMHPPPADCLLYLETGTRVETGAPKPWVLESDRRASDHWLRLYRLESP